MATEKTQIENSDSLRCSSAKYADQTPLDREWLQSIFDGETMNGFCLLVDGIGDVVELFLLEDLDKLGIYRASLMQSTPADIVAITGRGFGTRGSVHLLLNALGYFA